MMRGHIHLGQMLMGIKTFTSSSASSPPSQHLIQSCWLQREHLAWASFSKHATELSVCIWQKQANSLPAGLITQCWAWCFIQVAVLWAQGVLLLMVVVVFCLYMFWFWGRCCCTCALLVFVCSYVHLTFEKQEVKLFCIALLGFDPKYNVLQMYCTVKGKQVAPGFRSLRCICQEARRYSPAGLSPGADMGQCCTWGRCFGDGLQSLCHHGSCPLHPGHSTPNSPFLQCPHVHSWVSDWAHWGQPAGASIWCHREAANA